MSDVNRKQPEPTHEGEIVIDRVIDDLEDRRTLSIKKYGGELTTHNNRDALWDAYEEAMDLCMYLRQAILERDLEVENANNS